MTSYAELEIERVDVREALLVVVRWAHAAAAALLVGGSAFYVLILDPALRRAGSNVQALRKGLDAGFKELVDLSLVVFLISGGLLTFERLSSGAATTSYTLVLGLKVLLSLLVYRWAYQVCRGAGWQSRPAKLFVGTGFVVILLASVLKTLYESSLRP